MGRATPRYLQSRWETAIARLNHPQMTARSCSLKMKSRHIVQSAMLRSASLLSPISAIPHQTQPCRAARKRRPPRQTQELLLRACHSLCDRYFSLQAQSHVFRDTACDDLTEERKDRLISITCVDSHENSRKFSGIRARSTTGITGRKRHC